VWKRTSRRTLGDQPNKVATPRSAGGIPRRGVKRAPWRRGRFSLAAQGLVILLSSCLGLSAPQASGQGPQASVPMIADPGPEANSEGILSPLPEMFDVSGDDFALPADCGMGCPPSWYVQAEALYFVNEGNGPDSLSAAYAMPESSHEPGLRLTVGRRWDCSEALEISYVGPFEWQAAGEASGGPLNSNFFVPNGDVDISAFNGAEFHRQIYESTLHSVEINERYFDWDTMSCLVGLRYMDLQEDFSFASLGPAPAAEQGLYTVSTGNRLIGPQCGLDVIHPIGASNRLSVSAKTKLGLYANLADAEVRLVNAGTQELDNDDDDVSLAFQGELGVRANLRLTRRLSVHCGYELWYLCGLALADGQTSLPLTPATGRNLHADQDTWFHGITLGGQFGW
jgi:hypothetical protein